MLNLRTMAVRALFLALLCGGAIRCYGADASPVPAGDILPGFEAYLASHPHLREGGGAMIEDADGWLVVGVGTAARRAGKTQSDYELWKIADSHALRGLAEGLEGAVLSGIDTVTESGQSSSLRRDFAGVVSGSREVGRWKDDSGAVFRVMRVVFGPGHPGARARLEFQVGDSDVPEPWRREFLSRPFLRHGGVDIAVIGPKAYLLVVGTAALKGDDVSARLNAIRVAEVKAQAQLLAFYRGVAVQARTTAAQRREAALNEEGDGWRERVEETLNSRTEAQIRGVARGMRGVGGWVSADAATVARAFVVDADDL